MIKGEEVFWSLRYMTRQVTSPPQNVPGISEDFNNTVCSERQRDLKDLNFSETPYRYHTYLLASYTPKFSQENHLAAVGSTAATLAGLPTP